MVPRRLEVRTSQGTTLSKLSCVQQLSIPAVRLDKEDLVIESVLMFLGDGCKERTRMFFRDVGKRMIRFFLWRGGGGRKVIRNSGIVAIRN